MQEICYYLADDGKRFDDRWDCIEYERRVNLEKHKDDFVFLNYRKEPIPVEEATTEDVMFIVVKSESCAEVIGDWFNSDGCEDPFDGVYCECVGTWVYGDVIDRGDEWLKLELEIEKLQTLINKVNQ
jgi:hypothetical protein